MRVGTERPGCGYSLPRSRRSRSAPAAGSTTRPRCGDRLRRRARADGWAPYRCYADCSNGLNHLLQRCKRDMVIPQSLGRLQAVASTCRPLQRLSEHGMLRTARGRLNARLAPADRTAAARRRRASRRRISGRVPLLWDPSLDATNYANDPPRGHPRVRRQPHPPRCRHPAGAGIVRSGQRGLDRLIAALAASLNPPAELLGLADRIGGRVRPPPRRVNGQPDAAAGGKSRLHRAWSPPDFAD